MLNANLPRNEEEKLITKEEIPLSLPTLSPFESRDNILLSGDFSVIKKEDFSFQQRDRIACLERKNETILEIAENQIENTSKDLKRMPNNPFILNNLGMAFLNKGNFTQAEELFKRALEIKHNLKIAALNLANLYKIKKEFGSALTIYNNLLKDDPNDIRALANIGNIYLRDKKIEEAQEIYKSILKIDVNNIETRNKLAIIHLTQNKFNDAIAELRKCLKLNTNLPAIYNNLGIAYTISGYHGKAVEAFKIALKLYPNFASAIRNLAVVLKNKNDIEASIELLEKYLLSNENLEIRELLSNFYLRTTQYQKALSNLTRVLDYAQRLGLPTPEIARLYNNLGVIHHDMGELQKAETNYLLCVEKVDYANHVIVQNLIDLYFHMHKPEKEKEYIEILHKKFETNNFYLFYLGRYNFYQGEISETSKYLKNFLEQNKKFAPAYALLSTVYTEFTYEYKKAIELNIDGLNNLPNNWAIINNLAYSYLMDDDVINAKTILEKAKDITNNVFLTATRGLLEVRNGNLEEGRRLYNLAASMARYDERLNKEVEQKKNLELARYYFKIKRYDMAKDHLNKVLSTRFQNTVYAVQVKEFFDKYFSI
jgi:tetratricopeptide (TPR) repeat protein